MGARLRLLPVLLCCGLACTSGEPDEGTGRVLSLAGRVTVLAVEATTASRREDPEGVAALAVGLLTALGRPEDNVAVILFGEEAGTLLPQTTLAVKRVRPPAVVQQLDLPPLRGQASTAAALTTAQAQLEFYEDLQESAVVWLGVTPPDAEAAALTPLTELFGGRGWRVCAAPIDAGASASDALADLAAGTRGARYGPGTTADLLERVLELGADLNGLFVRVGALPDAVRPPPSARRLLLAALPAPGADLLGVAPGDGAPAPVWDAWIRRPADDGQPPYRICELLLRPELAGRAWAPRTLGAVPVRAMADLPLTVVIRPGKPGAAVPRGGTAEVVVGVRIDAGAETLLPMLSLEATFDDAPPVILEPRGVTGGELAYAGKVPVPDGPRAQLRVRIRITDPESGEWVCTRRIDVRGGPPELPPPPPDLLDVQPPEVGLGPRWADQLDPPTLVTVRAPAGVASVAVTADGPVTIDPPTLTLGAEAGAPLAITVSPGTPPGPLAATVRLEAARPGEPGGDPLRLELPVRGTRHAWLGPAELDLGAAPPGAPFEGRLPAPWDPVPEGGTAEATLRGPGDALLAVSATVEADGAVLLHIDVPADAVLGEYRGEIGCAAGALPRRAVSLVLRIAPGEVAPAATPARLELRALAGETATGEVTLSRGRLEAVALGDLVAIAGDDVLVAEFDAVAEVVAPEAPEAPARARVRLVVPGDLSPGTYAGELRCTLADGAGTVTVPVTLEVP